MANNTVNHKLNQERKIIVNNITETNKIIDNLNKLVQEKKKSKKKSKKKKKKNKLTTTSSDNCTNPSLVKNCSRQLNYWNIHGGNINSEKWKDEKNKIILSLKYILNSQELINLYYKYTNNNVTDVERKKFLEIVEEQKKEPKPYLGNPKIRESLIAKKSIDEYYSKQFNRQQVDNEIKNKKIISLVDMQTKDQIERYKSFLCEEIRLQILRHNCQLRVAEGYMINKSLLDMRETIKGLILSSLKLENGYLPIFWDRTYYPYCRNINITDNLFDMFYENNSSSSLSSVILNVMKSNNVNLEKTNFGIFTVINTTEDEYTNNPPNPPYIDVSLLIYNLLINYDNNKYKKELENVINRMELYSFYKNNEEFKKFLLKYKLPVERVDEQFKALGNDLLKIINSNNPSTLIGSLESTEILQKLTFKSVCTKNVEAEQRLTSYSNIGLKSLNIKGEYNTKYIVNYD